MKIARILLVPCALALFACSTTTTGSSTNNGGQPGEDLGLAGDGEGAGAAPDNNPDGVPYPTDNLGTRSRSGSTAGNRIANYKFLGYPDGDVSQGLKPMALADFYDPTGERYKVIHLQASGTWCTYCKQEMEVVTPLADKLAERKVVWIVSLAEGSAVGVPATSSDLDQWIAQFKAPYTHFLDSGNKNLGVFYDAAALPWNADINAKTMEILKTGVGAQDHNTEAKVLAGLDALIAKIDGGEY